MKTLSSISKIAVVGCGNWGKNLIRVFHELGTLTAICSTETHLAEQYANKYQVKSMSWEEILKNSQINAIVIASPATTHTDLCIQALQHNKHIFVEKPLALNLDDAEKICLLAHKKQKIVMVGHIIQYHFAFTQLKSLLKTNSIGKLKYLYTNRLNLGAIRTAENVLWDLAPHDISMILSIANELPNSVFARESMLLNNDIADMATAHLTFPSGLNAHVFVSWLHPFKEHKLVLVGSDGMLVFHDNLPNEKKLALYPHKINWQNGIPIPESAEAKYFPLEATEPLKQECLHFLSCIENNSQPITGSQEALNVTAVLEAAKQSTKSNKLIKLSKENLSQI